jgi:hypothetical protein
MGWLYRVADAERLSLCASAGTQVAGCIAVIGASACIVAMHCTHGGAHWKKIVRQPANLSAIVHFWLFLCFQVKVKILKSH